MTIILCIAGYGVGIWIASFLLGLMNGSFSEMDEFEMVVVVLWPILLICFAVTGIGIFLAWLWSFTPGKPTIEQTLSNISLVFQPYALGRRFDKWRKARCERKQREAAQKDEGEADDGQ